MTIGKSVFFHTGTRPAHQIKFEQFTNLLRKRGIQFSVHRIRPAESVCITRFGKIVKRKPETRDGLLVTLYRR